MQGGCQRLAWADRGRDFSKTKKTNDQARGQGDEVIRHQVIRRLERMSFATFATFALPGVTEWLQPMLAALTKFYSGRAWAAGDTRSRAWVGLYGE